MADEKELSLGEQRCHITFNPSNDGDINEFKTKCAELINIANNHSHNTTDPEAKRCFSLAMTYLETAQMYGVKGIAKGLKS